RNIVLPAIAKDTIVYLKSACSVDCCGAVLREYGVPHPNIAVIKCGIPHPGVERVVISGEDAGSRQIRKMISEYRCFGKTATLSAPLNADGRILEDVIGILIAGVEIIAAAPRLVHKDTGYSCTVKRQSVKTRIIQSINMKLRTSGRSRPFDNSGRRIFTDYAY